MLPESIFLEIRAGAGGAEASLFARDLASMYLKYAAHKNWKAGIIDSSVSDLGGYKEITIEIAHTAAFTELKQEAGVHRVQRIPDTEKSGRVHTSTASVAI